MSGQSITDRITAAQHSVTGSAISKTVCKATTHEIMGPKKKHLDSHAQAKFPDTTMQDVRRLIRKKCNNISSAEQVNEKKS